MLRAKLQAVVTLKYIVNGDVCTLCGNSFELCSFISDRYGCMVVIFYEVL